MRFNLIVSTWRTRALVTWGAFVTAVVWAFGETGHLRVGSEYSSQTVMIPLLCAYLLWNERERIFARTEPAPLRGAQVAVAFTVSALGAVHFHRTGNAYLFSAFSLLSAIALFAAGFVALYGTGALRRAAFPFSLLLLTIPFPDSVVQGIISVLQAQSTWLSANLFSIIGVPVYRDGFFLTVPGVTIEVARECSGINSSIALVLLMLLVARQSLRSNWRRAALVAVTIPLSILKNAIRITTLTMLALWVDPSFLTGKLHHQGGFVFYLLALTLMYPVWKLLKHADRFDRFPSEQANVAASAQQSVSTSIADHEF